MDYGLQVLAEINSFFSNFLLVMVLITAKESKLEWRETLNLQKVACCDAEKNQK